LMDYLMRRGQYASAEAAPRPGLILLDLNMPRKDGREALKEIRENPDLRRVPIVVFTTSRADTDIRRVYELGANSFITKPAAFDALVTTVTKIVGYWFGLVELPSNKIAAP
jgi:CheY-like chemotaxis protein